MKNMQAFYNQLASVNGAPMPQKRRLAALNRLNRAQLLNATSDMTWFLWNAPEKISVS